MASCFDDPMDIDYQAVPVSVLPRIFGNIRPSSQNSADVDPKISVLQSISNNITVNSQTPAFQATASHAPASRTPLFQTLASQTPVSQTPVSDSSLPGSGLQVYGLQAPVFQAPVFQAPASQGPVPQTPLFQTPASQDPASHTLAPELPNMKRLLPTTTTRCRLNLFSSSNDPTSTLQKVMAHMAKAS